MGVVGYTFDTLADIGCRDGIQYSMGYCGSGVSMASYLGTRIGQQVLGRPQGRTAFDGVGFPTRPLYSGRPWFLPASVAFYRLRDALGFYARPRIRSLAFSPAIISGALVLPDGKAGKIVERQEERRAGNE